jgi:hypothetical protein
MNNGAEIDDEFEDEGFPNELCRDFAHAIDATVVRTFESDFADTRVAFKKVEAEFIVRAGDDTFQILEMKRRVAEAILKSAVEKCETFETCRTWWAEMLCVGFTNMDRRCTMSWYYAECCRQNKKPDVGLEVLEPIIIEIERLLAEPTVTENAAEYYRYELDKLGKLRDRLKAQQQ